MSKEVLNRHWQEIRAKDNVLNVALANKFKGGKDTGILAIVVYVKKKVPAAELAAEHLIPPDIEGVPTDVVELAPTTWQAGETSISQLHPEEQLRKLGVKPQTPPKAIRVVHQNFKAPNGQSDWTGWANPIQDQENCGSCLSFDYTSVWETLIAIAAGNIGALIKLSECSLFFCTPNASCENGSDPQDIIVAAMQGVALEIDCPYTDVDQACGAGLAPNWWLRAKKLAGQNAITYPNEILSLLDSEPLAATFQVPQSFMNYTGGIYTRLGPQDPIVGGHGVGCFGYNTTPIFKIMRNQWGLSWGQNCVINGVPRPGWFMIDPSLLDPVMYQLILSNEPVPAPTPTPAKRCWLSNVFNKKRTVCHAT